MLPLLSCCLILEVASPVRHFSVEISQGFGLDLNFDVSILEAVRWIDSGPFLIDGSKFGKHDEMIFGKNLLGPPLSTTSDIFSKTLYILITIFSFYTLAYFVEHTKLVQ